MFSARRVGIDSFHVDAFVVMEGSVPESRYAAEVVTVAKAQVCSARVPRVNLDIRYGLLDNTI